MAAPSTPNFGRRTALVTGAARGIGRGIALKLAHEGLNIAINDIPAKVDEASGVLKELEGITALTGGRASSHLADITSESQVIEMIEGVVKHHGSLDVMVANAGIAQWSSLIESMHLSTPLHTSVEEADKIMAVNIRGVFLCYKYAAKQMIAQGRGGRIIGASSVAGKQGYASLPMYSASKFAVRGLTQAAGESKSFQSAARELGRHKITVNAYAPGCIETDMIEFLEEKNVELGNGKAGDIKSTVSQVFLICRLPPELISANSLPLFPH
ncbi:hypothetical protein V5O48_007329 [Marasmius crinis-equi]|uniref:NAD(P)-binding protein n=1 Tax=Marasmius crinis-equi TaxID=585013 RepID=A0ABR3FHF5_9AGAR